ncbi:hypothetical protein F5Y05DRAFT_419834 [Hypoxylon sp. FL0543]|nr:hypothetical protein F5Y05DRAFT_419834 [Hypoxylon sp. FL0543]
MAAESFTTKPDTCLPGASVPGRDEPEIGEVDPIRQPPLLMALENQSHSENDGLSSTSTAQFESDAVSETRLSVDGTDTSQSIIGETSTDTHQAEEAMAEETIDDETATATTRNKRLPMRESLGITGCLIIIGGTVGSLAGLGFLIFLWTAHGSNFEASDAPKAWRTIMLNGWMEQATTLSTLLIRIITASQATVCTAMLASLFLEKRHVRKADVAQFSVMRAVNDGPRKLAELVFTSPRSTFLNIEALLVLALALSGLALQFSSTILFSDFHESTLVAFGSPVQVVNYITQSYNGMYLSHFESEKPINAIFGEVSSNVSSVPDSKGFSDTGLKQRAFLPFDTPENRTGVRIFQGDTAVMSSRFTCMRPNIHGTVYSFKYGDATPDLETFSGGQFSGSLDYGSSLRDSHSDSSLCNSQGCFTTEYNCSIPGAADSSSSYQSAFCSVGAVGGEHWLGYDSIGWDTSDGPWTNRSLITLVYSSNMLATEWSSLQESFDFATNSTSEQGEWIVFQMGPGRFLNVSLCFSIFSIDLQHVNMIAEGPLDEPIGNWSMLGAWDSSAVRTFLGADPLHQGHAERSVLTITDMKQPDHNSSDTKDGDMVINGTKAQITYGLLGYGLYRDISGGASTHTTWQGCLQCIFDGNTVHPEFAMLVGDTIEATGRAADALQSYTTALALTWYTDFLKTLTGTIEVNIAFTKMVQTAHMCKGAGCKGLISVASLLGFYLLCVLLTTILFLRHISHSRQGNTWHSVSQLLGDELQEALEEGNDKDDAAMEKWMKKEGKDDLVTLQKVEGKIQVVKRHVIPQDGRRWIDWLPKLSKAKESKKEDGSAGYRKFLPKSRKTG